MWANRRLLRFLFFILFSFFRGQDVFCQNYVFAQMTGVPLKTTGWNLQGGAQVLNIADTNLSELLLCSGFWSSGAAFWNQPINLSYCNKWTAEFDFRMYDGTGADGIAFCFLDVPPSGFVNGGGLGIPNTANGLKVCFDTWNNCIPFNAATVHQDMPKIEIRWGFGYDDNSNPNNLIVGECVPGPTRTNSDGQLSFIRSPNYNHAKITYDNGNISVFVNGILFLTAFQKFDFSGYLGFTASTGGYSDDHSIKNVIIYTQMPPSIAGNDQGVCPNDTIQIGGPSDPTYLYSWSPSAGLSDSTISSPYLLNTSNNSDSSQLHTYFVKTSFKNNPGCASADSIVIKIYPNPKVHFTTPSICLTDAVAQFYDSSYTHDPATLPFTWLWNFGDPNALPGNPNSSTQNNPAHRYSAASNYPLTLEVTNSQGCKAAASKIFTVNGAVPKAEFNVNNQSALCSNQSLEIVNNSSVDFGSITKVRIFWGDSAAVSYIDSQPYPGKIYSHLYPNPVSANVSGYTIRMISSSGITCEDELDRQVNILPSPHVQFDAVPPMCDYDSPVVITQARELTGLPGSFSFSGNGTTPAGLFDPRLSGAGEIPLLYEYSAMNGCVDSTLQTIMVYAPPILNAGKDTSVVVNQPLQLYAQSSDASGDSFLWSPATGLNDPFIQDPIATLTSAMDSIRYFVKGTDSMGCYGEASVKVKIFKTSPDIFVPNAFTPGGSTNNIFRPIPVGISSLQYFRVYDRWGQLVFSTSRLGDGWDGNVAGKPQDLDSYVWTVEGTSYTGEKIFKRGTVTLIR